MYTNCCCCQSNGNGNIYPSAFDECLNIPTNNRCPCAREVSNSPGTGKFPPIAKSPRTKKKSKLSGRASNRSVVPRASYSSVDARTSKSMAGAKQMKNSQNYTNQGRVPLDSIDEECEVDMGQLDEEDRSKRIQESCADFLSIVHDNVVDTVEKSVERILRDYFAHTMDRVENLCGQMMRNECMLSKMYLDLIDKLNQQNEKSSKHFRCLCKVLTETNSHQQLHKARSHNQSEQDSCEHVLKVVNGDRISCEMGTYVPADKLLSCRTHRPSETKLGSTCDCACVKGQRSQTSELRVKCACKKQQSQQTATVPDHFPTTTNAPSTSRQPMQYSASDCCRPCPKHHSTTDCTRLCPMQYSASECNATGMQRKGSSILKRYTSVKSGPSQSDICCQSHQRPC